MTTPNRRFIVVVFTLAMAGAGLGFGLSCLPQLTPYKLLNITGIVYGLLGIVVLAELVMKSDRMKVIMVSYVAGSILWSSIVVPLGMLIGAGLAFALGKPSAAVTAGSSASFVAWSILPLSALDATVFNPSRLCTFDLHGRHQMLGLMLVLGGGLLQLVAAVCDLLA